MRICLVTAFPPSRHHLSEYGFRLAEQLRNFHVDLTVLADEYTPYQGELPGYDVRRCWRFDALNSSGRILRAVREARPDIVWFNLVYSTFGSNPVAAFAGLCTPAAARALGYPTHVTLHHLMENVDLGHADVDFPALYRLAGSMATRLLLRADSVSVLLERYRHALRRRYGARNVRVHPHGTLGAPHAPQFRLRGNTEFRILALGKWGRYKRLEPLLESFPAVRAQAPNARLLIAGCDHPNRPGYLASLAEQCRFQPQISFLGYLSEARLPQVFKSCHVAVMPYLSSGGPSGVAHLACQFGLPIVAAAIDDLVKLSEEEGFAVDYYDPSDSADLAAKLVALARDPERQRRMAEQNYQAALRATMPKIVGSYLSEFAQLTGTMPPAAILPEESEATAA